MVMGMTLLYVWSWWDRFAKLLQSKYETCYCQYIHDTGGAGEGGGFLKVLPEYLKVEQRAYWLLIQQEPISCAI